MKTLFVTVALVAFTASEPPPSKSYLPPSSTKSGGYPQGPQGGTSFTSGTPEVVAARSLERRGQEHHGNGFARNSPHDHGAHARFGINGEHGYEQNGAAFGRNVVEDVSGEPANYNFGYMVNDYNEGTDFGHHEERLDESAHGQYHVVLPDGRRQTVSYEADGRGFKPLVTYQDSEDRTRSGYDSNASSVRASVGHHDNGFGTGHENVARANGY
ncbi:unnamed protein product [Parnassius apollo]|uniref:(apollo) hypothetical protein n=1 Tax=Parnassius apollo TaxID=110799 RepID=A0A8S3WIL0_PARAO|nr:unnamed protein product [Parnassius apollo]